MDLMRILRSLEEFLYELVGWLVFYPRTCWRIVTRPAAIARYTLRELEQPEEQQFTEAISPVLMLILSVVIAHGVELITRQHHVIDGTPVAIALFGSEQMLLLTRCVVFCTFAFAAALSLLHQRRSPITRDTLRAPFSVQAFLISPLVLGMSLAMALVQLRHPWALVAGPMTGVAAVVWYLWARASAYRALSDVSWLKAFAHVLLVFSSTFVAVIAVMALVLGL